MKVIAADHERRYEIPGVPGPARRPVDIDASKTGFTRLRSLRLYRFNAGSVIDGHAEEDEVFVVVTSGSVEMKIGWEDSTKGGGGIYTLAAPGMASEEPFVAYLPPRSVYQLTPIIAADIAYARATAPEGRAPAVFGASPASEAEGISTLLQERTYAQRLRLKIVRVRSQADEVTLNLLDDQDIGCEALVHVQGSSEMVGSISVDGGASMPLHSWKTVAIDPGEHASLTVVKGTNALLVTVLVA